MDKKISENHKKFADYFLELGNATEAYMKAYPKCKKEATARTNASRLLTNTNLKAYIDDRTKQMAEERIAKPQVVLEYLTRVMLGQELDQFGLDAGLSVRTKAAELLAKRYRLFDAKDNRTLTELEKEKGKLEIEYKRLQNEKMKAEIARINGEPGEELQDDGFIDALKGTAKEDWEDEKET